VREVLARCEELRVETKGFFDVRAAREDRVDPSGLVKGWSVDRAAAIADELGWRNYAINAGGDVRLRGGALPAPVWRVGLQHPSDRQQIVAVVAGDDLAVATSGAYARGEHVLDPHTGRPPEGVLSVTVTGPDLATADASATRGLRDGERRAGLDSASARLRGDDRPGRRPLAADAGLSEHYQVAPAVMCASAHPCRSGGREKYFGSVSAEPRRRWRLGVPSSFTAVSRVRRRLLLPGPVTLVPWARPARPSRGGRRSRWPLRAGPRWLPC
jgi:hypothetical protein